MDAAADLPDDDISGALAYVCRRLDYLRRLMSSDPVPGHDPSELRALISAVTAPQQPSLGELQDLLRTLHQAVQAAGDPLGVRQTSAGRSLHLPGIGSGPFEAVYQCPIGRCSGRRPDQSTVFPLTCTITGRELQRKIL